MASQVGVINGLITYDTTPPPLLVGDYNGNGIVDAADYVVWRKNLGSDASLPNDSTPGFVTPVDYDTWKSNIGRIEGVGTGASLLTVVPEPPTTVLLVLAVAICGRYRRASA